MAEVVLKTVFQLKRGNAEAWTRNNPVLKSAEPGYELDTGKLKLGDGVTAWNDLPYFGGSYAISTDNSSITFYGDELQIVGFAQAEAGQSIRKTADGKLEWYSPTTEPISISRLENDENTIIIFDGGSAEI